MTASKHYLKLWPKYFQAAWVGDKTFEIRFNDRNYQERDEVVVREWDPELHDAKDDYERFTGREIEGVITYLTNFEQKEGYVVFAVRVTGRTE